MDWLNLAAIVIMVGTFVWALFDWHNRLYYAQLAQIVPILFLLSRRLKRWN
jgi:hypothetical protein